jgi:squalene-associated FAD-dependent desaturase
MNLRQHPRVVVVGGGLAGMSAALALQSGGANVTLLESRKLLGGRAGSFQDPQTGELLDNCQHVLLGCCTNLIDFYRRMGVIDLIQFDRAFHFRDSRGRRFDLAAAPRLPAPSHLAGSFLGFHVLSWTERLALSQAMLAMLRLGRAGRAALADMSFGDWLDQHLQPASLVSKLYDPILVSALNEETRVVAADCAIAVFQDSLLVNSAGCSLGIPRCSLSGLYSHLPCPDTRLGARVALLHCAGQRVTHVQLQSGEAIPVDVVVLATSNHQIRKLLPPDMLDRDIRFAGIDRLQSVPILGAHLWFDRRVIAESHAALLPGSGGLQWVFRKDDSGTSVHGVISAARDWVDRPKGPMLREFEQQIRTVLPLARGARLLRGLVVIEKRATFSPRPGTNRLRPRQTPHDQPGAISNLYLAGDYTRTDWPATMEGAVRSGYLAAEALLAACGRPAPVVQPDLGA